eukprot:NODE_2332_length_1228_cov_30.037320_g2126_i0.p1 GENE.NODE_2332_length_1228_cov_30.037320_g2126_i0~~NODE_2332_length_1228_cov_30.037320_g2126_i0.p1  ORF type:complete len:205 (-),score=38.25 NODE_2332_length_1228_cov_30.037320_g2126_i0:149-763(-)
MRVGEVSRYMFDPCYAFRENGYPPLVPPEAVVEYEIELLSFVNEMTDAEKLMDAKAKKECANGKFKAQEWAEARQGYKDALRVIGKRAWRTGKPELDEEQSALRVQLLNNVAAVYFQEGDMKLAAEHCSEALALDPKNARALLRRGRALVALNEFEAAQADLLPLLDADPDNPDVHRAVDLLQQSRTRHCEKEKQMWGKALAAM